MPSSTGRGRTRSMSRVELERGASSPITWDTVVPGGKCFAVGRASFMFCRSAWAHRHGQRRMKGLGTSRSLEIHTHLVCRYSLIASVPDSRPMPEFLKPPNGDVKLVAR